MSIVYGVATLLAVFFTWDVLVRTVALKREHMETQRADLLTRLSEAEKTVAQLSRDVSVLQTAERQASAARLMR